MMGEQSVMQEELFYGFSLERHVPADHLLRAIDRFVDLSVIRRDDQGNLFPSSRAPGCQQPPAFLSLKQPFFFRLFSDAVCPDSNVCRIRRSAATEYLTVR
ncbi:hypothetical protein NKH36_23570 [Mesorhizobium sp. M1312]|uniref:hypothetical protein n=1 Tax=unclassified Mesorhizobium TaxID=325217 RepID=UPI00333AB567